MTKPKIKDPKVRAINKTLHDNPDQLLEVIEPGKLTKEDIKVNLTSIGVGKPLKYTPANLLQGINNYIQVQKELGEPLTISGLCLALGTTRETLREYGLKPEYVAAVKTAKLAIANGTETNMLKNKTNAISAIFHLTNLDPDNWKQRQDVVHSGGIMLGVIQLPAKQARISEE